MYVVLFISVTTIYMFPVLGDLNECQIVGDTFFSLLIAIVETGNVLGNYSVPSISPSRFVGVNSQIVNSNLFFFGGRF